ncbi:hypothetical protein BOX15_Mlig034204g1 [Macrostomum lignano]|uniref:Uncharacterized protein n=1 Tax=Macrostomum lignano TaxID=282301 RepID=A0A267E4H3_9PLAT|nr:hypothetical protein BOX15_Mlig034204g1 [Macrostomum lignano]
MSAAAGDAEDSSLQEVQTLRDSLSNDSVVAELRNELLSLHNRIDRLALLEQFRSEGEQLQASLEDIKTNWSAHYSAWRVSRDEQDSKLMSIEKRLNSLESDSTALAKRQTQLEQELHQVRMQQAGLLASMSVLEKHAASCPQYQQQQLLQQVVEQPEPDDAVIDSLKSRLARVESFMQQQQSGGMTSTRHRHHRRRHQSPPSSPNSSPSPNEHSSSISDTNNDTRLVENGTDCYKYECNRDCNRRRASSTSSGWSEESLHGLDYSSD